MSNELRHVKLLALIAIVASQIAIVPTLLLHSHRTAATISKPRYKPLAGMALYKIDGNPIDGWTTNFCTVLAATNGWVKLDSGITLQEDVVQFCFKPVPPQWWDAKPTNGFIVITNAKMP